MVPNGEDVDGGTARRLPASGPARKGLIAAVTSVIEKHNDYILEVDEHLNPPPVHGRWFMPIEIEGFNLSREEFGSAFAPLALGRRRAGRGDPLVISNHPDLAPRAERYNIPFYHLPVTKETKSTSTFLPAGFRGG